MGAEVRDLGQVVLESEPYRRLSYSWHTYQREWIETFGSVRQSWRNRGNRVRQ